MRYLNSLVPACLFTLYIIEIVHCTHFYLCECRLGIRINYFEIFNFKYVPINIKCDTITTNIAVRIRVVHDKVSWIFARLFQRTHKNDAEIIWQWVFLLKITNITATSLIISPAVANQ